MDAKDKRILELETQLVDAFERLDAALEKIKILESEIVSLKIHLNHRRPTSSNHPTPRNAKASEKSEHKKDINNISDAPSTIIKSTKSSTPLPMYVQNATEMSNAQTNHQKNINKLNL